MATSSSRGWRVRIRSLQIAPSQLALAKVPLAGGHGRGCTGAQTARCMLRGTWLTTVSPGGDHTSAAASGLPAACLQGRSRLRFWSRGRRRGSRGPRQSGRASPRATSQNTKRRGCWARGRCRCGTAQPASQPAAFVTALHAALWLQRPVLHMFGCLVRPCLNCSAGMQR
jgi:hypothetical protein